jgi:hypothetical protein
MPEPMRSHLAKLSCPAFEGRQQVKEWTSPPNARRLGVHTPCADAGFCSNCGSPDRICRVTSIVERKPPLTDLRVRVVNEDLGL